MNMKYYEYKIDTFIDFILHTFNFSFIIPLPAI